MFKFLEYVSEGKLIRNNNLQRMTFTDVKDLVALYFMALQIMRYYPQSRKYVTEYAKEVLKWNGWEAHRISGNDLYNLLNIVDGDEKIMEKLKDPKAALAVRQRMYFPTLACKRLLRQMATGALPNRSDASDLMKIDSALKSNYSALRRLVSNYDRMTNVDRKKTVTKTEFALKARGRNSDIIDYFIMFVMDYDLEARGLDDTEPMISMPDATPDVKDIALLRMLGVPSKDLPFAYKVYSLASKGMAIPPRFAQAYAPIMKVVDDIIKAGPGYVNLLKQVHNRAKVAKK